MIQRLMQPIHPTIWKNDNPDDSESDMAGIGPSSEDEAYHMEPNRLFRIKGDFMAAEVACQVLSSPSFASPVVSPTAEVEASASFLAAGIMARLTSPARSLRPVTSTVSKAPDSPDGQASSAAPLSEVNEPLAVRQHVEEAPSPSQGDDSLEDAALPDDLEEPAVTRRVIRVEAVDFDEVVAQAPLLPLEPNFDEEVPAVVPVVVGEVRELDVRMPTADTPPPEVESDDHQGVPVRPDEGVQDGAGGVGADDDGDDDSDQGDNQGGVGRAVAAGEDEEIDVGNGAAAEQAHVRVRTSEIVELQRQAARFQGALEVITRRHGLRPVESPHVPFHVPLVQPGDTRCTICLKEMASSVRLAEHLKIHAGTKKHRCDNCGKHYASRSSLRGHVKACGKAKTEKCPYARCTYAAATSEQLKRHQRVHKPAAAEDCVCPCGKKFRKPYLKREHYATCASNPDRKGPYPCLVPECRRLLKGKPFTTMKALNSHMKRAHQYRVQDELPEESESSSTEGEGGQE